MKEHLGHFYDKTSDFQQSQFDTLRALIETRLTPEERAAVTSLIDIGCGTGSRTLQCFDIFPNLNRVLAVDPDVDMIDAAHHAHADPRVDYRRIRAEELDDLALPPFDFVMANWSMHWVENKAKLFHGLTDLTHARSRLAFSTCETLPEILQFVDDYIRREFQVIADPSPFHYLALDGWRHVLGGYGWPAEAVNAFLLMHEVDDARRYLDHWFTASAAKFMYGRHIKQLSEISHEELLAMMRRVYPAPGNPQGLSFVEKVMFVIARRKS